MPQELAMFPSFTIGETLQYYGQLHGMSDQQIREKTDFMIELLNLPPNDRKVSDCSGGQQRRASIAVTLFHDPPLLILDEPTVGVDPLLRCKIWQYLEYLCQTKSKFLHSEFILLLIPHVIFPSHLFPLSFPPHLSHFLTHYLSV